MSKFYITCAIDYPNALPHIGTAFEKLGADVQARWRRMCGDEVRFLMGNDENTQKIKDAADKLHEEPRIYAAKMAEKFEAVWQHLHISNDDFIRTTEDRHIAGVHEFIGTVHRAGYIYKKPYKGLYCQGCEEFKAPNALKNGKCPNHPNYVIDEVEEENYFFALSEFRTDLLRLLHRRGGPAGEQGPTLEILPESRYNEVMGLLREPLEDISISRMNKGWGIPIPWDREQVIYVWFDALLNYLTGVGFGTDHELFQKWWPADCHLIGKDITRFHCILFPAMILAYNSAYDDGTSIAMPKKVYSHGFLYEKKNEKKNEKLGKVSKSSGGGVGTIAEIVDEFGPDAYRYYFLAKCRYHDDSEFSRDDFLNVYNADLANNLGNLVSRVNSMIHKYFDKSVPFIPAFDPQGEVRWLDAATLNHYRNHMDAFEYHYALQCVWGILDRCNEYIDREKPWEMAKVSSQEIGTDRLAVVLRNCVSCLRIVSILLKPLLPQTANTIHKTFFPMHVEASVVVDNLDWDYLNSMYDHEQLEHMDMDGSIISLDKVTLFPRVQK